LRYFLRILSSVILLLSLWVCFSGFSLAAHSGESARLSFARWSWTADFSHGIRGWLSYPLAQDIGFDPGLYTAQLNGSRCLVREVKSYGQHVLRVGLIKPLPFRVTSESQFNLRYQLKMGGPIQAVTLTLAAENGRRYEAPLPHESGTNSVTVRGRSLGVPHTGAEIQALVIEATVQTPVLDSSNRLVLRHMEIVAERHNEIPLIKPELEHSASEGPPLAAHPVQAGGHLTVEARSRTVLKISVFDADGKQANVTQKRLGSPGQKTTYQISFPRTLQPGLWRAVLDSGAARTEFQFLVPGNVPPHPRVLLTRRRIKELRSQNASSPFLAALRVKAKDLRSTLTYSTFAGTNIAILPRVSVFPGLPQYFSLLENYSNSIAFNAVEYQLTGDQAVLEAARKGLMTVASWPTWTPAWFSTHGLHTYYEVGVFSQRLAVGYDLIADRLTHAEKERITEALWQNGINPTVEEYFSNNRMPIAGSNWMANSIGGAVAVAVALYGDLPDWNARLGTALAELTVAYGRLLDGLFPGDDSEAEPAGYQEFAMKGLSYGMAALHALGIRPRGTEKMLQSFWWPRYAEVSTRTVLDTGDFGGSLHALSGFAWEAEYSHDPSLRAFYDTAEAGRLLGVSNVRQTGRSLEAAPGLLDLTCCSLPAQPAPLPPPSRIFPRRGSAVLRSGWKSTDTVMSIRVGPWFNHEHHDQGTFQVASLGRKLISEAGYANYYTDPNYQTYFMQAPGHNTVLIDGNPFSQPGENGRYWKALARYPHFTAHVLSPDVDYLSADLAEAYGGVLSDFQREFIFLKPDVLIVHDRLQAPLAHRYDWLMHVPLGAATNIRDGNATITVDDASAAITAIGPNNHWSLQKTPLAGDRYSDLDRIRLDQPYKFVLGSEKSPDTSFLVGMKFEKSGQPIKSLTPVKEAGREGFFDRIGGWSWVSKAGPGVLGMDGITAHGQSLGVRKGASTLQVFGTEISSLHGDEKLAIESSTPVDLSLNSTERNEEIHFYARSNTTLKAVTRRTPVAVELDERQVHPRVQNNTIVLNRIGKGEHVIRVFY
jgi:Heparinase II/III-like protein